MFRTTNWEIIRVYMIYMIIWDNLAQEILGFSSRLQVWMSLAKDDQEPKSLVLEPQFAFGELSKI